MKKVKIGQFIWASLDHLLLGTIFALLALVWYLGDSSRERVVTAEHPKVAPASEKRVAPERRSAIDALRVSTGTSRMTSIARTMVDANWERSPCCQAMDMREDGDSFEIVLALPSGVLHESVRVGGAGNVLNITMWDSQDGAAMLRRVRLPCYIEGPGQVTSAISNNLLRVRIQPGLGR